MFYFIACKVKKNQAETNQISLVFATFVVEFQIVPNVMDEQGNDIARMLALLHTLAGAEYSRQVERIARRAEFQPIYQEKGIFYTGGEQGEDFDNLIAAARKVVEQGFSVYLLPNPKGIRTADFILERKGTYKIYDLKTIQGQSSAINRLMESIGQTNRVVLNIATDYNPSLLARNIRKYFERNIDALEVLVLKGHKAISISRELSQSEAFYRIFMKKYTK